MTIRRSALSALVILSLVAPAHAQQTPVAPAPAATAVPSPFPPPPAVESAPAARPAAERPAVAAPATMEPAHALTGAGKMMQEMSPWSMFMAADVVVKAVMISLALASVVTWTIFIAKTFQLLFVRRRLNRALAALRDVRTLNEAQLALGAKSGLLSSLLAAATNELRMSADSVVENGVKERAASRFSEISRTEARVVRNGMGALATIGAIAPFVGLFGTVWGIMNSFIGISKSQTTNLAVVAPGIAEALLATAIGLVAAIPAVIIYNHFSRGTKAYLDLVGRASGTVGRLLSRDLDRGHGVPLSRAAE